jgi:methionyl-tRNA formyltransferase
MAQDSSRATYSPKLSRESGRIDWNESSDLIERKIRAYDPWPGTFIEIADAEGRVHKLKIFRATARGQSHQMKTGTILPDESSLQIATGTGLLQLEEVQLEGKRRMSAADFLRGFSSPSLHF